MGVNCGDFCLPLPARPTILVLIRAGKKGETSLLEAANPKWGWGVPAYPTNCGTQWGTTRPSGLHKADTQCPRLCAKPGWHISFTVFLPSFLSLQASIYPS